MKIRTGTHVGLSNIDVTGSHIDCIVVRDSDLIARSYQDQENLLDFNYSDTMSRFVCEKELSNSNVIELPYVDKDKRFQRKLSLEVVQREVIPLEVIYLKDTGRIVNAKRGS